MGDLNYLMSFLPLLDHILHITVTSHAPQKYSSETVDRTVAVIASMQCIAVAYYVPNSFCIVFRGIFYLYFSLFIQETHRHTQ